MFRVITVSREFGSGGAAIGRIVADSLGWTLLDKTLIEIVALAAQVHPETARQYDERVESWWRRISHGGIRFAAIDGGLAPSDARPLDAEGMAVVTRDVIAGAAAKGECVIVGRGAQCVLQTLPDALHVFVYAPWSDRIEHARRRMEASKDPAEAVRSIDQMRAGYVRKHFGCDWKDPHLYHLMISSQLGYEKAAALIVAAVA